MPLIRYENAFALQAATNSQKDQQVPLGFSDKVKWLPLDQNILIVGGANLGRTAFLRSIVYYAISQYSSDSICLWLYDAGLNTFTDFSNYKIPHIMLNGMSETDESVVAIIDTLAHEVTSRQALLASMSNFPSFDEHLKETGTSLAPKCLAVFNFAETFFRRLRELPKEYSQKFLRIVQASTALNICVVMCIQNYDYFLRECGISETYFPRRVAIVRADGSSQFSSSAPVAILSNDYPLPWLSPIWLSQEMLNHFLKCLFPRD